MKSLLSVTKRGRGKKFFLNWRYVIFDWPLNTLGVRNRTGGSKDVLAIVLRWGLYILSSIDVAQRQDINLQSLDSKLEFSMMRSFRHYKRIRNVLNNLT